MNPIIIGIPDRLSIIVLQVYWLRVDYLESAEAALHCSASMTALLFVEEWYKEHNGCLTLGSTSSGSKEVASYSSN